MLFRSVVVFGATDRENGKSRSQGERVVHAGRVDGRGGVGSGADGLSAGGAGSLETGKGTGEYPEFGSQVSQPVIGFVVADGEGAGKPEGKKRKKKIVKPISLRLR